VSWRVTYHLASGQSVSVLSSTEPELESTTPGSCTVRNSNPVAGHDLRLSDAALVVAWTVEPVTAPVTRNGSGPRALVDVSDELAKVLLEAGGPVGQQKAQQLVKCGRGALLRAADKLEAEGKIIRSARGLELVDEPVYHLTKEPPRGSGKATLAEVRTWTAPDGYCIKVDADDGSVDADPGARIWMDSAKVTWPEDTPVVYLVDPIEEPDGKEEPASLHYSDVPLPQVES